MHFSSPWRSTTTILNKWTFASLVCRWASCGPYQDVILVPINIDTISCQYCTVEILRRTQTRFAHSAYSSSIRSLPHATSFCCSLQLISKYSYCLLYIYCLWMWPQDLNSESFSTVLCFCLIIKEIFSLCFDCIFWPRTSVGGSPSKWFNLLVTMKVPGDWL